MSFARQVVDRGPVPRDEVLARPRVGQRAQVVDERVRPDVDDLLRVPRDGNAPRLTCAADREVLEPARDEAPGLVRAERGQHEVRTRVVELEQGLLVGGEPEEPVPLLDPLGLDVVLGALAVDELLRRLERLAADAVEPRVDVLVDVVAPVVADALEELLDEPLVPVVARPDEEVVRDAEAGGERPPRLHDPVDVRLGRESLLVGHPRDLRRMLVDPGEQERVTAALPLMTSEHVRRDRRVGMADVRRRVDVVDRGCQVVRLHPDRFYGRAPTRPGPRRAPGGSRRRSARRARSRCRDRRRRATTRGCPGARARRARQRVRGRAGPPRRHARRPTTGQRPDDRIAPLARRPRAWAPSAWPPRARAPPAGRCGPRSASAAGRRAGGSRLRLRRRAPPARDAPARPGSHPRRRVPGGSRPCPARARGPHGRSRSRAPRSASSSAGP